MNRLTLMMMMCLASIISSCMDTGDLPPEVHGDPQIVDSFDFAIAWNEAKPTSGKIVVMNQYRIAKTSMTYARSGYDNLSYPKVIKYLYSEEIRDSSINSIVTSQVKGIINDLGDTILYSYWETENEASTQRTSTITHIGIGLIYSHISTYGGESSKYLKKANSNSYDLMKTMKSTYRTIKYLQTIYPDSMIPMGIFENDPK